MEVTYPVIFPDGKHEIIPDDTHNREWQDSLAVHRQNKLAIPRCSCRIDIELKLYIGQREGHYYLARYPNSGCLHNPDCQFFELAVEGSGLSAYEQGVIKHLPDGTVRVKLKNPLSHVAKDVTPPTPPETKPEEKPAGRRSKSAVTMVGLIDLLFYEAGLAAWHPRFRDRRTHWVVIRRLYEAAARIKTSRDAVADGLIVGIGGIEKREFAQLAKRNQITLQRIDQANTPKRTQFVTVLGEVEAVGDSLGMKTLKFCGFGSQKIQVIIGSKLLESVKRIWPVFGQQVERGTDLPEFGKPVVMVLGRLRSYEGAGGWTVIEAERVALRYVCQFNWLPARPDPAYLSALSHLVGLDRSFIIPLVFDGDDTIHLPDFVLTDTNVLTPVAINISGKIIADTIQHEWRECYGPPLILENITDIHILSPKI
jgi:hypothetical protein